MSASPNDTTSSRKTSLIRIVMVGFLICLSILTGYRFYRSTSPYQVNVYHAPTGWGYDILNNGKLFIHQPTIPGQAGMVGFASQEQAQRVGERVAQKIQEKEALPSLTNDELRQLGVTIP